MTTKANPGRRSPRFARVKGKGMRITARDLEILRAVFRYRFLRSSHIVPLAGGSKQQILRRLRDLFDHGLLDRPLAQASYKPGPSNDPLVYGLATRGARVLAEADPSVQGRSDWSHKNKRAGEKFLNHTLLISDVMVAFELACREQDNVELIDEPEAIAMMPDKTQAAKHPLHWKAQVSLSSRQPTSVGLFPDRVFSLAFDGKTRVNFVLEADRSTMRITPQKPKNALARNSFNRKLLAYHAGWKAKYHTTRFGWQNFRVLTVTTGAEHARNLAAAAQDITEGGGGMFLFTDLASLTDANPLTHDWLDGKGRNVQLLA